MRNFILNHASLAFWIGSVKDFSQISLQSLE